MKWDRLPVLALLALGALSLGMVFSKAPMLDVDYRTAPGVRAEWARTAVERKEYALAHAWAAVRAKDGPRATILARDSLNAAPMNAYAWLALAWGEALSEREEEARSALDRSYELAPRSMALAQSRVALAQRWWQDLDLKARLALLEEIRIARGLDAHAFNLAAAEEPRLAILHKLALSQ